MWSAAVLEPALPGRKLAARNSSVLSHHTPIGWYPNVRLYVGAAGSFSLCVTTMVASTSSTTVDPRSRPAHADAGTPPGSWDHTCRRARARATWIFLRLPAVTSSSVRHTVGAEDHPDTISSNGQTGRPRRTLHLPSAFCVGTWNLR